jgi:hypothetical protein
VAEVQPLSLAPPSMVPEFDVVRIEPDGTGVVAGQALAGITVAIMIDNAAVVETVADASGRFVDFLTLPPSDQPRVLSLVADPAGAAVLSTQTVVIAPTVAAEAEAGTEVAGAEVAAPEPEAMEEAAEAVAGDVTEAEPAAEVETAEEVPEAGPEEPAATVAEAEAPAAADMAAAEGGTEAVMAEGADERR